MKDFLQRIQNLPPKKLALLAAQLQSRLEAEQAKGRSPGAIVGIGWARSRTTSKARAMPEGSPMRTRISSGAEGCRRMVPTVARSGRRASRTSGQVASIRA